MKFAAIGDTGSGNRGQYETGERMAEAHARFPFEFVIMLGDNMYGRQRPDDFVTKFELPYKKLLDAGVKFYAALGNHDEQENRFYKPWNMDGKRYYTFTKKTRLIGLPKAVLYVSNPSRPDFVVFVILRKKDKNGKLLMHLNFPFKATPYNSVDDIPKAEQASLNLHLGSIGVLRASQRAIDSSKSLHPQFPFHPHEKQELIEPGTVIKLEIGIWSMGVDFDEGESISLQVSSVPMILR